MIHFLSSETHPAEAKTVMDVYSYAEDWSLITISDVSPDANYTDGQGDSLTYGLGGKTGEATIPHLFAFSQHCSTSGQHIFPDMSFLQEHVSENPMKQWMEIVVDGGMATFTIGEFPIENPNDEAWLPAKTTHEDGYSYSYSMTAEAFRAMAAELMELHAVIFSA